MEKALYQITIFFLALYTLADLVLVILAIGYAPQFPQLQPFRWVLSLSLVLVIWFLRLSVVEYRKRFRA